MSDVQYSPRGFARFPEIKGSHSDTTICVYESSSSEPSVWMKMEGEVWTEEAAQRRNDPHATRWPSGIHGDMTVHLSLKLATELRDQLTHLIDNHFLKR